MDNLGSQLRKFIIDELLFGVETPFSDDDSLLEQGIIDSTGVLELITFLEETYSIRIGDSELVPENLDSVNNLVSFIDSKRQPEEVAM